MGEATERKAKIETLIAGNRIWLESLSPIEQAIASTAQMAYDNIVVGLGMTEGCYHLSFFLHEYLRRFHNIELAVVVGWINDGQWEGATSHAWLEFGNKKIDVSLHRTTYPDVVPPGDLIILDHVVRQGVVTYKYWIALPESAQRKFKWLREQSPDHALALQRKMTEHHRMVEFSKMPNGAAEYLRQAPSEGSYAMLEQRMYRRKEY